MMDSENGYHITVDMDAYKATARMAISQGNLYIPLLLTDEQRRDLIALLQHGDDDAKNFAELAEKAAEYLQKEEKRKDFKLLKFRGNRKEET